ncbi:condensin-2 complex subunit H2 [Clinocottus analis]|uniref:condensin-2 complex subunit H2 n=1 Tax=Clinocottus analis TaxID=304258 RepID=UPI0035BF82E9
MEFTESRFPHLLQPIRELTKNWEIDVASELNDYLEELDNMCITFDGGKTRLNFAEAALLIQGSACIYSKKVELLHSLVYQTLQYITDGSKKRSKQASPQEAEEAAEHGADDAMGFTPLDIDVSGNPMKADSNTTVNVAPLPPESLIPLETTEKHKLPLISLAGDVLSSQKDFRINVFVPGAEDVILLSVSAACRLLLPPAGLQTAPPAGEAAAAAAEDHFLPLEDDHMEPDQERDPDPEEHVDRQQAPSESRRIRERRAPEPRTPPHDDVWTSHDPYSVLGGDAPFRAGRCHAVPAGLDGGGKRKRRRVASLQDFNSWFRRTFDPPEHKLKNGPTSPDLNYIYVSTMKNKLRTQKRINRKAGVAVSDEELRRTFLQPEEAGPHQPGEEPVDGCRPPDLLGGDDDSDNEQEEFPDDLPDFMPAGAERDELSYEDLVKLRVEQLVVTSRAFTQETALSRRVKDWEDKIRPELVLQEQRSVFDIHDYGDRIVSALNAVGQRRNFSSIVSGLHNYEACKYLLASLQLANDLTVELDSVGRLEDSVDTMGLKLLSTLRANDRFKALPGST